MMISEILSSPVVSWFFNQGKKQPDRSTPAKFTVKSVLMIIALVVIAYFAFRSWWTGRKLAKARHERDVSNELRHRRETQVVLERNEEKVAEHEAEIAKLVAKDAMLKSHIIAIRDKQVVQKEKINAIKSWEEFDKYVNRLAAGGAASEHAG